MHSSIILYFVNKQADIEFGAIRAATPSLQQILEEFYDSKLFTESSQTMKSLAPSFFENLDKAASTQMHSEYAPLIHP